MQAEYSAKPSPRVIAIPLHIYSKLQSIENPIEFSFNSEVLS